MIWPDLHDIDCIVFDFDGVFTDNKVYVDQNGVESVCCDRRDGLGVDFLRSRISGTRLSSAIFILSKERNPVVLARAEKMKLKCVYGIDDKLDYIRTFVSKNNASDDLSRVIYLGNDLNDLPVVLRVGFSVVPQDAHEQLKSVASVVLPFLGGQGFVRAFIERLLGITNLTAEEIDELVYHS